MALLRSIGSRQTLNLPFGFSLIFKELTQSEWPSTAAMMPCLTISSSLFYTYKAILCGACTTGLTFLTMFMWYSKSLKLPTPEKHSWYISLSSALFLIRGHWCRSPSGWIYLLQLLAFSWVIMVWMSVSTQSLVTLYTSGCRHSEKDSDSLLSGLTHHCVCMSWCLAGILYWDCFVGLAVSHWLHLLYVIPSQVLQFRADFNCYIWVLCEDPHLSQCIQPQQHWSLSFYNMKNKSPVLVIPFVKNDPYVLLLDRVVTVLLIWSCPDNIH